MKKLFFILFVVTALVFTLKAQTKRIAHRSHSGPNTTFDLYGDDNFGNPYPEDYWINLAKKEDSLAKVDSLKKIGVYPYLYQAGEFAKESLKFWGKMILDTTVQRQQNRNDGQLDPPFQKPKDKK